MFVVWYIQWHQKMHFLVYTLYKPSICIYACNAYIFIHFCVKIINLPITLSDNFSTNWILSRNQISWKSLVSYRSFLSLFSFYFWRKNYSLKRHRHFQYYFFFFDWHKPIKIKFTKHFDTSIYYTFSYEQVHS